MDFDLFAQDPLFYIHNRVQTCEKEPDLGLGSDITEFVHQNPEILDGIPLIQTQTELMDLQPGKLARMRLILSTNTSNDIVPLVLDTNQGRFSFLARSLIPSEFEVNNVQNVCVQNIIGESIRNLSGWCRHLSNIQDDQNNVHLTPACENGNEASDEEFIIMIKFFDDKIQSKMFTTYDVLGFLEEPSIEGVGMEYETLDNGFFRTLPVFVGLALFETESLYPLTNSEAELPLIELRHIVLDFLLTMFEPLQAELILLWLVSRTRNRSGLQTIGSISINFTEVDVESSQRVLQILQMISTILVHVDLSIDNLNSIDIQPCVEDCVPKRSIFETGKESRYIFNETLLQEGTLTEKGIMNIKCIQELVSLQSLTCDFNGSVFQIDTSNPCMVLSNSKSIISCDCNVRIGVVGLPSEMDSNVLHLIRVYCENTRKKSFNYSDNDAQILKSTVLDLLKSQKDISIEDAHFFANMLENMCISMGADSINEEILSHTLEMYSQITAK